MQRLIANAFLLAMLAGLALAPATAWADAREDVVRGLEAGRRGAYLVAIKLITEAIASGTLDATQTGMAYKALGITHFDQGDTSSCLKDFTTALELIPGDPDALYYRGLAYARLNDPVSAKADAVLAVGAFFDRGVFWLDRAELDNAIADFSRAIELNPNEADYYTYRGMALNRKDDPKKALDDFNKAADLAPDDPLVYLNRGNAWKQRGSFENTLSDYDRAIELDPDYNAAYFNRGLVWVQMANFDMAIQDFSAVIRLDPTDWAAFYRRGQAYDAIGKDAEAKKDYKKVQDLNPAQLIPELEQGGG